MCQQDGLGPLQMRVTGNNLLLIFFRKSQQHFSQLVQGLVDVTDLVTQVQSNIQRDLIVTASAGVQFATQRPDLFRQSSLDIHMNIFESLINLEFSFFKFLLNLF